MCKFYCENCGREITGEQYYVNRKLCNHCYDDLYDYDDDYYNDYYEPEEEIEIEEEFCPGVVESESDNENKADIKTLGYTAIIVVAIMVIPSLIGKIKQLKNKSNK